MDSGQVLRIRHSSEPRISLPVASFSLPQKRQPIDDINLLEIIDTHTNFKGRSTPGSNNKPPDAQGPTSTGAPVGSSFDPKLLLGPRQYKFPTRPSPNTNNLHDSSNLSHGRNGVKIPTNTASGGADGGDLQPESNKSPAVAHGNMIEDIYGVERRENQPLKRIKVDNKSSTSNYDGPEARFSTSGTSALGSYMKEKPDDEGRTAVTTNNTIDLTAGEYTYYSLITLVRRLNSQIFQIKTTRTTTMSYSLLTKIEEQRKCVMVKLKGRQYTHTSSRLPQNPYLAEQRQTGLPSGAN